MEMDLLEACHNCHSPMHWHDDEAIISDALCDACLDTWPEQAVRVG